MTGWFTCCRSSLSDLSWATMALMQPFMEHSVAWWNTRVSGLVHDNGALVWTLVQQLCFYPTLLATSPNVRLVRAMPAYLLSVML